jgi:hypothetical protein
MSVIGIIPAAGTATRIFSLPKFMLPMKDNNCSLMTNWFNILENCKCSKIIIGSSPTNLVFINHIVKTQNQRLIDKIYIKNVGNTETMSETICKCLEFEDYKMAIMVMPDTHVEKLSTDLIFNVIQNSDALLGAYLWNIQKTQLGKLGQCKCDFENNIITDIVDKDSTCTYKYGWGAVAFKPEFEKYILKEDPHIGYSMNRLIQQEKKILYDVMPGMYFDCGTIQGYSEYINYASEKNPIHIKGTIIMLSIYINNTEKNYNELVDLISQIRTIYKHNIILAIDNNSLNTNWHSVAKELNIIVLLNTSALHKYEMGAYKFGLQHYRADKYIFIQGNINVLGKFDLLKLDVDEPNAIALETYNSITQCDDMCIECDPVIIDLSTTLLKSINIDKWECEIMVLWNSFCCNDLFVKEMIKDGLFNIITTTKEHSCSFEYMLGSYMMRKLNKIDKIDSSLYHKVFMKQL